MTTPGNLFIIYKEYLKDLSDYGMSIYKNILILWDEDQDTRIFEFIDNLDKLDLNSLQIVHEHEGTLCLYWKISPPSKYINCLAQIKDDSWIIQNTILPNLP